LVFCSNNDISNILSHHHGSPHKLKSYFVIGENYELKLYDGNGYQLDYNSLIHDSNETYQTHFFQTRSYLIDYLIFAIRNVKQKAEVSDEPIDPEDFPLVDARDKKFKYWEEKPEEIYQQKSPLSWSPQMGVNHVSAYIHNEFEINSYQWSLFELILSKLKTEVENTGGRLVVMLLPVIFNPRDVGTIAGGDFEKEFETPAGSFVFRSAEPRDRLRVICSRLGITFFDPTEEIKDYITNNNLFKNDWPDP
jgi:hypothetical protein